MRNVGAEVGVEVGVARQGGSDSCWATPPEEPATAPAPADQPAQAPNEDAPPSNESAPAPRLRGKARDADGEAVLQHRGPIGDLALPAGPGFRIVPLLPGLGLLVETSASPVVQRVAGDMRPVRPPPSQAFPLS